jgi:hypothetical protein
MVNSAITVETPEHDKVHSSGSTATDEATPAFPFREIAGWAQKKGMVTHPFSVCHSSEGYFMVVVGVMVVVVDVMVVVGVMVVVVDVMVVDLVMVEEVAATAKLATLRAATVMTRHFFICFSFCFLLGTSPVVVARQEQQPCHTNPVRNMGTQLYQCNQHVGHEAPLRHGVVTHGASRTGCEI